MKILITLAILLLLSVVAVAQHTTVTAQVIDTNSQIYRSCTGTANFAGQNATPGAGPYLLGGVSTFQTVVPIFCDGAGNFTISLTDNNQITPTPSQWRFQISTAIGSFPGPTIGFNCLITITGATQNVTAPLTVCATLLPVSGLNVQTNSVNNASQGLLNFVNSATVTWSNPSGGVEQANVVSSGLSCTPITNFGVVYINNAGACITSSNLTFGFFGTTTLAAGANGAPAIGAVKANSNTNNFGATMTTNSTGTQLAFSANGPLYIFDRDTSTTPINYTRIQSGIVGTLVSDGFEYVGAGDVNGSGSAAGFKVANAASTGAASPGAANIFAAGNAGGNDVTSHGGDTTFTTGTNTLGSSNARGGDFTITTGAGAGTGRGGNINFITGAGVPAGKVLCNGNPCFNPGILLHASTTTIVNASIPNTAATVVFSSAVTMPATGCPCRVSATWWAYLSVTNSGQDAAAVSDGTNTWAGSETATTGAATGFGFTGAGTSPGTYANNAVVTFTLIAASSHAANTTYNSAPVGGVSLTGAPASALVLDVYASN